MKFMGFHHIGLAVRDTARSLQFYTEGLGGTVVGQFPLRATGQLIYLVDLGGNATVELIPRGTGRPEADAHWEHLAILTDDAQAAYDAAVRAGAQTRSAPAEMQLGALRVCNPFVLGPDGEVIEFFEVKD